MANEVVTIDSFFKGAGLSKSVRAPKFWEQLQRNFGGLAVQFGDCINERERGVRSDPYKIKNSSLEFANAVLSQFDQEKLKSVALWMLRESMIKPGSRVLEVGCDNGLLLCLLAKSYPQAIFVGLDTCREAVELARQRASLHGIQNVEFLHSDASALLEQRGPGCFDIVFAIAVFHEVLAGGLVSEPTESIFAGLNAGFDIGEASERFSALGGTSSDVASISSLLDEDGKFVSVDRWAAPPATLAWVRTVEASGFQVHLHSSSMISYSNPEGGRQSLPLTCFKKGTAVVRAIDVVSLHAYPVFSGDHAMNEIKSPLIAEMVHGGLSKQRLLLLRVAYPDGDEQLELGLADGLGYLYQTTTRGFRKLWLFPSVLMLEKAQSLSVMCRERRVTSDVSVELFPESANVPLGITHEWLTELVRQ